MDRSSIPAGPLAGPPVPQVSPGIGYDAHRAEIDAAIALVLNSGTYVLGEQVGAFERAFAQYTGVDHAVGVGNGTDAVALALRALGVKRGDKVATVSHTAVATVAALDMIGAQPVLIDISADGYTMDPGHLADTLATQRVAAVVVVHLYGQPANLAAIGEICRRQGAWLVEDCAQAHGALWQGQRVGSIGDASAFSFYPTKNLGGFGDGGLLATRDAQVAERARAMRQYGWNESRVSAMAGVNSRLDELQASILRVRLAHLDRENARRRAIAALYDEMLADCPLHLPPRIAGTEPVFHQYVVASSDRDGLRARLLEYGIGTAIHYPVPAHLQPGYAHSLLGPGGLPNTERAARQVLSLPMFPQLTDADAVRVAVNLRHVCRSGQ